MGRRLLEATMWLSPIAYPDMPEAGHRFIKAFAAWVLEYEDKYEPGRPGTSAGSVDRIHTSRLRCRYGRERICREWPGYWDPSPRAGHPEGRPQEDALKRTGALARAYGAARIEREPGDVTITHVFVRPMEAAVAQAQAMRDIEAHLTKHPISAVAMQGVDVRAKQQNGVWPITEKTVHPRTPTEAAEAILEKIRLEYVGTLPGKENETYPNWRPTGDEAAALLRETASALTGTPVAVTAPPPVRFDGARLIATPELVDLIPALGALGWCRSPSDAPQGASNLAPASTPAVRADSPTAKPRRSKRSNGAVDADVWALVNAQMANR